MFGMNLLLFGILSVVLFNRCIRDTPTTPKSQSPHLWYSLPWTQQSVLERTWRRHWSLTAWRTSWIRGSWPWWMPWGWVRVRARGLGRVLVLAAVPLPLPSSSSSSSPYQPANTHHERQKTVGGLVIRFSNFAYCEIIKHAYSRIKIFGQVSFCNL